MRVNIRIVPLPSYKRLELPHFALQACDLFAILLNEAVLIAAVCETRLIDQSFSSIVNLMVGINKTLTSLSHLVFD